MRIARLIPLALLSPAFALRVPLVLPRPTNHIGVYAHSFISSWFTQGNSPMPVDPRFFEDAIKLGWRTLRKVAMEGLEYASHSARDAKGDISQFKDRVDSLVLATQQLHGRLFDFHATEARHLSGSDAAGSQGQTVVEDEEVRTKLIDWNEFSEEFARMLQTVQEGLKSTFPPPDQAANHAQRVEMISAALSQAQDCFISLGVRFGIPEERSREFFEGIKPIVQEVLVVAGDLAEQHPELFVTVLISGVLIILPEGIILRPLLGLFGFGPYGPVKGSSAAWAQSRFFGAVIPARSWFSVLQSLGMKVPSMVAAPIGSAIGWMGATIGSVGLAMRGCM